MMFTYYILPNWDLYALDFGFVIVSLILILAYYFSDILSLLNLFQRRGKSDGKAVNARSYESQLLLRGLFGFQQTVQNLNKEKQSLNEQVLSGLKHEINLGKTAPYEFNCTLARIDLNNYSKLFSTIPTDIFSKKLNQFFEEVNRIVSNYGGYIYEYVGDEVIFYFKDENHPNSALMALSAVRDIMSFAKTVDRTTRLENKFAFTLKSSLAYGKLRFGQQVHGFSLSGSILIETVRILSHIQEKEENTIVFDELFYGMITSMVFAEATEKVLLKGLPEAKQLYLYKHHTPLNELLDDLEKENCPLLTYYRSNEDLSYLFKFLQQDCEKVSADIYILILKGFYKFHLKNIAPQTRMDFMELLNFIRGRALSRHEQKFNIFLSALSMGATHIFDVQSFDEKSQESFQSLLQFPNMRVVANTIDVLTHFSVDYETSSALYHLPHDNRVQANVLVQEGKKEISPKLIRKIKKMLKAKEYDFIASALYAIGEIASHHKSKDFIYYVTHIDFLNLVAKISTYFHDPNIMVRRQALIAARKINDEALNKQIEDLISQPSSQNLREEIEKYFYKDVKDTKKAA
jgi:class 3 adenylate cyclase